MTLEQAPFQRVLITGGSGFIGSHLVPAILRLTPTTHVCVIDNYVTGRKENLAKWQDDERLRIVEHDVTDSEWLRAFLEREAPFTLIFHFASPASPPRYQAYPVMTYLVNSLTTHVLAEYAAHSGARMVFASTSEVYGDPLEHPQRETYWGNVNPNGARSCYDESKRMGETISGVFHRDFGADTRLVRIFNTYGPNMDPGDGRVIPQLCMQALRNEPLTLYGDGTQTRSFCYVEDLVDGILRLAGLPGLAGETVNIGNPVEWTMLELVTALESQLGRTLEKEFLPLPSDDPRRRRPDISKAKEVLGWEPQISLEQGLYPTVSYFAQWLKRQNTV